MNNNIRLPDGLNRYRSVLHRLTVSAVFLSFAVVIKAFTSFYLPVLGAAGLKIDFSGIFTAFPALMFGPLYGGAVCALADFLGYLIKPSGVYIPLLTLTAFASGFLTGLFFHFVTKNIKNNSRVIAGITAAFFLLLGLFGVSSHVSLNADNIINGLSADSRHLPARGILESAKISPLSRFICGLARYSNDTITVTRAPEGAEYVAVPETTEIDGFHYKITKIDPNAFKSNTIAVFLSSNITSVDSAAFADSNRITIFAPADSFAAVFAVDNGFDYTAIDYKSFITQQADKIAVFRPSPGNYDITNKYRENLAGYINFLTIGFEIIALFVLTVIGSGFIFAYIKSRVRKSNIETTSSASIGYIPILLSVFLPRLLITTVNTEILRQFFTVWSGRAFIVLWVPRAAEEILSGIVQTYIIMLLYAVYESKFMNRRLSLTKHSAKEIK